MKYPLIFLFLLTSWGLSAVSSEPEVISDIPYLGAERSEAMDAYLPGSEFARPRPAMLLIHGGGWRVGDKASTRERSIANDLVAEGYAVFSINYKLNVGARDPDTKKFSLSVLAWPQNFYDCKSALRFIRKHADEYGVDPARIGVMGGSAGGHLAMMVASTAEDAELNQFGLYTEESNAVACVLNLYGEFDVRGQSVSPFMGASWEAKKRFSEIASPVTHFTDALPPMLVLHGTADETISVERSRALVEKLKTMGAIYEYLEVPDAPHSFDFQPEQMDLRPVVFSFLNKYLKSESVE